MRFFSASRSRIFCNISTFENHHYASWRRDRAFPKRKYQRCFHLFLFRDYASCSSSHCQKGDSGKVLVIGGSPEIHGAPLLAGFGALATGVDLVRLLFPKTCVRCSCTTYELLVGEFSGNVFSPSDAKNIADIAENWASAVVLGCGFLREELEAILFFLQNCSVPIVLDAGALQPEILPEIQEEKNVLLTPAFGRISAIIWETAEQESVVNMAKNGR